MEMKRTIKAIKFITDSWNALGIPYSLKHGTYTTILESELGKHKFVVNQYNNRVFIAKNKVKKDVLNSDLGKQMMSENYETKNFGIRDGVFDVQSDKVLNLDISSAYVHAIYNAQLITKDTFDYLQTLKKGERLPALGMLASSYTKFYYEDGKCKSYEAIREPTANIFFKLIEEVNDVMEECKWVLGSDYIFHWVDGVFFQMETSVKKINQIEKIMEDNGFPYKYESVKDFNLFKDEENFVISMIKNDEYKKYEFSHRNEHERIKRYLAESVKGQVHSL
jgi:hypothetical protein